MSSVITNKNQYIEFAFEAAERYNAKDYDKALQQFLELATANPDNIKVHETLAFIYLKKNQIEKADAELAIVLKLAAKQGIRYPAVKTFNDLVESAGDVKSAEADFNNIMKDKTSDSLTMMKSVKVPINLSILYMSQGKYDLAEEVLLKFKSQYEKRMKIHL